MAGKITKEELHPLLSQKIDDFAAHEADYVSQPANGGVTGGASTAYTCSSSPAPSSLVDKIGVVITAHVDSGANPTLNWNGKGAKPIVKHNGNPANLKKDGIYTLRLNATKQNFILQGEGGVEVSPADIKVGVVIDDITGTFTSDANAVAGNVLSGKTAYVNGNKVTGTMPNNPAQTATLQITGSAKPTKAIPAGYTPGGTVTAELALVLASNILSGNTIGGVAGSAWGVTTVTAGETVKIINTSPQEIYCGGTTPVARSPQFKPKYPGTIRIKFKFNGGSYGQGAYARVYKNGIAVGTLRSVIGNPNTFIFTEDFSCVAGDVFQVYAWGNGVCEGGYMTILDIGVYVQDQFPSYFD